MGTVELDYVHSFKDRHGKQRHYFRKNGKRTALPGSPGSPEFMDAYAACKAGLKPSREPRKAVRPRSIADLILRYYGSVEFKRIPSQVTRGNYKRILDAFSAEHGDRMVSGLNRERISKIIGDMSDKPGAAIVLLKRLKTVINYGMTIRWITEDPTHKLKSYTSTPFHTWTEEEIALFESRWPVGSRQRLAFALHLYTGQRRSDVHRMTWRDYDGSGIKVVQQKTKAKLTVAVHPKLKAMLDATPRKGVTMLITELGAPFTVGGYGNWTTDAIRAAGLPDECKLHGLRKAAARRLAESGCTASEIAAITGHKTLEEVELYTREADQKRLAKRAIRKQSMNG